MIIQVNIIRHTLTKPPKSPLNILGIDIMRKGQIMRTELGS